MRLRLMPRAMTVKSPTAEMRVPASAIGIEHFRKHGSRDDVTSPVDPIGRLDEMFVAPTNRGVFTWPGVGPIHKKDQHGVRHAAVATRSWAWPRRRYIHIQCAEDYKRSPTLTSAHIFIF